MPGHDAEQQRAWDAARERITPPKQGPEGSGDEPAPEHDEAKPLEPLGAQKTPPAE